MKSSTLNKTTHHIGLPFGRFDGHIPQSWPFYKAVGRRKLIWLKKQKLAEFWPSSSRSILGDGMRFLFCLKQLYVNGIIVIRLG